MRKALLLFVSMISLLSFVSCEEDDSPILFSTTDNIYPQNVKIEYYSPDPCCVPRSYKITTNRLQGELTLKCTNAQKLFLSEPRENSRMHFAVTATGETDWNTLVHNDGNWSVSIINDNYLKFVFLETPVNSDLGFISEDDYVIVNTNKGKKVLETSIIVRRILNDSQNSR